MSNSALLPFRERYDLLEELGSGATAKVYQVQHKISGNTYAAKIINKRKLKSKQISDLHQEINTMRELNHPSIVHLKESIFEDDKIYLVLEEMRGGELFERVIEEGCFREEQAKEIFYNLTCAVAYLHHKGIVHRDLKPENILLKNRKNGDESNLCLCDFGVSALLPKRLINKSSDEQERSQPLSRLCGSPEYMAPEVINADRKLKRGYGPKCDVWSLGIILYVLLCGQPPFGADDVSESEDDNMEEFHCNLPKHIRDLFRVICKGNIDTEVDNWRKLSPVAKKLILQMLSVDPMNRPTARQILCNEWFEGLEMPETLRSSSSSSSSSTTCKGKNKKAEKIRGSKSPRPSKALSASYDFYDKSTEEERMLFLGRREFLLDIGDTFSRAKKLHHLLEVGVRHACELMQADRGSIFVVDEKNNVMFTEIAEKLDSVIKIPLGKGLVGTCYNDRSTINVRDTTKDKRFDGSTDKKSGYNTESVLCVPIMDDDGSVMGVAQMINKMPLGNAFDDEDIHLLEDFAIHISLAMSRVHFGDNATSVKAKRKRRREDDKKVVDLAPSSSKRSRKVANKEEDSDDDEEDEEEKGGFSCSVQ
jgi:serine/threonine protein kinase